MMIILFLRISICNFSKNIVLLNSIIFRFFYINNSESLMDVPIFEIDESSSSGADDQRKIDKHL